MSVLRWYEWVGLVAVAFFVFVAPFVKAGGE